MKKIAALLIFISSACGAQQIASTNATGPNGSVIGYYAAGHNWLYVPVDSNGYLMVDCPGCSGGTPGGSVTQVQYNNTSFAGDPTFTFNSSTKQVGVSSLLASDGLIAGSDGVHAGLDALSCNTTNPATVALTQGWAGSTGSASCTPYYLNIPDMAPAYGAGVYGFMVLPVPTANFAKGIWSTITTDTLGNLNVPGNLAVAGSTVQSSIPNDSTQTIASATTIAPTKPQVVISGTAAIVNMTVPGGTSTTATTKTCGASDPSSGTATCTLSTPLAVGETAVCAVFRNTTPDPTFSVTDSNGDTFVSAGAAHTASTLSAATQTFYFGPLTQSITTITVSGAATAGQFVVMACQSATGVSPTSPVDGQCFADTSSGTSIPCGSAITTTQNGDYLLCNSENATGGDTFSVGSGFTAGSSVAAFNTFNQYLVQATAGSITPNVIASMSAPAAMQCTAFKAVAPTAFAGCFHSRAAISSTWSTTTAGNIQSSMTAVANTPYDWCYWPDISKWTVK